MYMWHVSAKEHNRSATFPETDNPLYLSFTKTIVTCLFHNFVAREKRLVKAKVDPSDYVLNDLTSESELVVGFEDIVERLPGWLCLADHILQSEMLAQKEKGKENE